jgi:two-component system, chemotaxis family, CheB/CheR fusion protein
MKSKPAGRTKPRGAPDRKAPDQNKSKNDLLIAAIGASAGGIEACTELVSHLPTDTGMAFVLVQHLDPEHHSMLTEILSKKTSMAVREVTNGMTVEANHFYVIPARHFLAQPPQRAFRVRRLPRSLQAAGFRLELHRSSEGV